MTESFYVVWNPLENRPARYADIMQATEAARRLAQANPGDEIITFRAIQGITWSADPWRTRQFCKSK
jgi:hypothetical protein